MHKKHQRMNASNLSHEIWHSWIEIVNFAYYLSNQTTTAPHPPPLLLLKPGSLTDLLFSFNRLVLRKIYLEPTTWIIISDESYQSLKWVLFTFEPRTFRQYGKFQRCVYCVIKSQKTHESHMSL